MDRALYVACGVGTLPALTPLRRRGPPVRLALHVRGASGAARRCPCVSMTHFEAEIWAGEIVRPSFFSPMYDCETRDDYIVVSVFKSSAY